MTQGYTLVVAVMLFLAGYNVDDNIGLDTIGKVILYRDGEAKVSSVSKIGSRCWVSWYKGIEKLLLKGDGTIYNPPFHYKWTLYRAGPDDPIADKMWFDANCVNPT